MADSRASASLQLLNRSLTDAARPRLSQIGDEAEKQT